MRLETNEAAFAALRDALEEANRCANRRSEPAWKAPSFGRSKIPKWFYRQAREQFPELSSQTVVRSIARASDSSKPGQKAKRKRRRKILCRAGGRRRERLKAQQGEPDLALDGGKLCLAAARRQEEPAEQDVADARGVDLGVSNPATGSDGSEYSGSAVKNVRHRYRRLRRELQKIGTKPAKRRLRNLPGQEQRFANDVHQVTSKKIAAEAHGAKRAIALEDLGHIRGSHFLVAG